MREREQERKRTRERIMGVKRMGKERNEVRKKEWGREREMV